MRSLRDRTGWGAHPRPARRRGAREEETKHRLRPRTTDYSPSRAREDRPLGKKGQHSKECCWEVTCSFCYTRPSPESATSRRGAVRGFSRSPACRGGGEAYRRPTAMAAGQQSGRFYVPHGGVFQTTSSSCGPSWLLSHRVSRVRAKTARYRSLSTRTRARRILINFPDRIRWVSFFWVGSSVTQC